MASRVDLAVEPSIFPQSSKASRLLQKMKHFMDEYVYPAEKVLDDNYSKTNLLLKKIKVKRKNKKYSRLTCIK